MNLTQLQAQVTESLISTKLVQSVLKGQVRRSQYVAYLGDVYSYALHSAQVIALAGTRLVLSHPALAGYLFHHAAEELGHDKWALRDLQDLGLSDPAIAAIEPSSACRRMIALEYFYAGHGNPVGLFGWMFVLESLGGRIGGGVAQALDRLLELNGKAIYFLAGHGEADSQHSDDLYRVISESVRTQQDLEAFTCMAAEACDLYAGILDGAWSANDSGAVAAPGRMEAT